MATLATFILAATLISVVSAISGHALNFTTKEDKRHYEFSGFTSWAQGTLTYNSGNPVVFQGVNVNEGGYYQSASGRFFCPEAAVYFVAVNAKRTSNGNSLMIMKDGQEEIMTLIDNSTANPHNIISNNVLVQCNTGQFIEISGNMDSGEVFGESGIPHSTFTVFVAAGGDGDQNFSRKHNESFTGFSAYLQSNVEYSASDIIPFGGVQFSSPGYNAATGIYTCPVSGVYFVTTNLRKQGDNPLNIGVSLDTQIILHSDSVYNVASPTNVISNSRFVQCNANQQLSVKGTAVGNLGGSSSNILSTFSAMLIHRTAINASTSNISNQHSNFIGFSAFKTAHQQYDAGTRITFQGILINEGNHFDGTAFTCPSDGIYFLSVNFRKIYEQPLHLDVMEGNVLLFRSQEATEYNELNTVSNNGIFRCFQGQEVFVQGTNTGSVHGDPVKYFSTFSIMFLYSS